MRLDHLLSKEHLAARRKPTLSRPASGCACRSGAHGWNTDYSIIGTRRPSQYGHLGGMDRANRDDDDRARCWVLRERTFCPSIRAAVDSAGAALEPARSSARATDQSSSNHAVLTAQAAAVGWIPPVT